MAETHPLDDPKHWRDRAEEVRSLADQMSDPVTRRIIKGIADDYEKLAKRAEERMRLGVLIRVSRSRAIVVIGFSLAHHG